MEAERLLEPRRSRLPGTSLVRALAIALVALVSVIAQVRAARADDCVGARGRVCTNDSVCSGAASSCISGTCQIPCGVAPSGQIDEQPKPNACSIGETCSPGTVGTKTKFFCKPTPFRMDLNLLDSCIYHFVEGITPAFDTGNQCSVIHQLTSLLDQNGSSTFDINDVDLCIKNFVGELPCNTSTQTCANSQTYCAADATCGEGLYCNQDLHRCERECGFIVDRDDAARSTLDRACTGTLQTCNYDRGQCRAVSLDGATCQLDRDCPTGAYCLTGQCAPRCYRSLDCPDSSWTCGSDNTCQPKPKPGAGAGFNPKDYSVVYSLDSVQVDPFQNQYSVPLLIMSTKTGKQVFQDPQVVFGYRLEAKYERKEEAKCNGDLTQLSAAEKDDCIIAPTEEFLTLGSPFGTLYADGNSATKVSLNSASEKLSPGVYPVLVTAFFNNGQSTSVRVRFKKPSPSGEYQGRMSAYLGSPDALLSTTGLAMHLYIRTKEEDPTATVITWAKLAQDNNIALEKEFEDITEGYPVTGFIHASESLVFDKPGAVTNEDNEIPVKGLYSPQLGRLRLISVIDLPKTFCVNMFGQSCSASDDLKVENTFGRAVRRIVEFIGPFRPAARTFEGQYRETISGLTPSTFTLEGGFRLLQGSQDNNPVVLRDPLLSVANAGLVTFPTNSSVSTTLRSAMTASCGATLANTLSTKSAVDAYLASYGTAPPVFPQTVFEDRIRSAIQSIGGNSATSLTFAEYLTGNVKFCSATPTTGCIDQAQLACGLAFLRRAVVENWFDTQALGVDAQGHLSTPPLFCNRNAANGENNCADASNPKSRGAVVFQDHNRYYRELTQTLVYQANAAWSDAFNALYKANERADAFGAASAYDYKQTKLREAIKNYDAARAEMLASPAAAVLFSWPMSRFQGVGAPWLAQMQTVFSDRLDAWTELADLKRRVMQTADLKKTYTFAKHVMNQEYLAQVFLAELQRHWQGSGFEYAGQSGDLLARGDVFLAKLSDSRNPLGLSPDRVYFENNSLALTNWQNYRAVVSDRITAVKATVDTAVQNLHGALQSQADLEAGLLQTQQGRDASLDEVCGPVDTTPVSCRGDASDKALATSCDGPDCAFPWTCDTSDEKGSCARVVKLFSNAVDSVSCRSDIDSNRYQIQIGKDALGVPLTRSCNRGRVGSLLQERVKLDSQRKQVKTRVEGLLRQIASEEKNLEDSRASSAEMVDYLKTQRGKFAAVEASIAAVEGTYQVASATAQGVDCLIIVGLATGTNCAGKAISTAMTVTAIAAKYAVVPALQLAASDMGRAKEIAYQEKAGDAEVRSLRLHLDSLVGDIDNSIAEYQLLVQQLYSIDMQVSDSVGSAQNVANRFAEQNLDIVKRLVGQDSGQTVRANRLIQSADKSFQSLLVDAYKMTRAFIHRYNYADNEATWTNRVYRLMTIADVQQLVSDLTDAERNYCGLSGGDCDAINNRQVMRFSLREQLFPQLKDIVDPTTGNVLYAGEQFHNLITSSIYRRRRLVQGSTVDKIEIPFAIRANDLGNASGAQRPVMLERGECNHIIVADRSGSNGTFSVNVKGTRVDLTSRILKYEVVRGGIDQIRTCDAAQVNVSTFTVGRPVIESAAQSAFQTRSGIFSACMNNAALETVENHDQPAPCWNYFARDRSLAAPDWIFTIPLENQQWILGIDDATKQPIAEQQRPIIEDVVMYFRYNARPSD